MATETPQTAGDGLNRLISRKAAMAVLACYLIASKDVDFYKAALIGTLAVFVIATQAVIDYHKTDHGLPTEESSEISVDKQPVDASMKSQ
jgi:hypothetical protein